MTTIGMTVGSGSVQNATYFYVAGGHGTNSTTGLVQTITQFGTTLTYAYDNVGNITSVSDGTKTVSYTYDKLGQLTRANDPYDTTAGSTGTTWVYAYDQGGNILSKTAYAYTTGTVGSAVKTDSYTYGDSNWKDKLTAFNGTTISYDAIGNPTSDGTWTYTWEKGRQLKKMVKSGETATFTYNADGLRVKKVCTTTGTTNYTLHGKNVVHLSNGSNNLHFFYDAQNRPAVVVFNGAAYGYVHNLQGDIVAIVNSAGTKVVEYTYDPWGKPLSKTGSLAATLGTLNPFRYRGYVYDEETGLCDLRSRYYNSWLCRFLNPDVLVQSGIDPLKTNRVCYCTNNPVIYTDSEGTFGLFAAIVTVGAILGGVLGGISAAATGGDAGDIAVGILEGAVNGAVGAYCGLAYSNPVTGVLAAFASSFSVDVTTQAVTQLVETGKVDSREIDWDRSVRTGLCTAAGTAVPAFGLGPGAAVDAFATALIWGEASTVITVADIIYVNTRAVYESESIPELAPDH